MYIFKKTPTVLITLSFICIFVVSCTIVLPNWPGGIWKSKSWLDNSTILWMEPAGIGTWLKLSLYKSSVMIEDDIFLIAIVFGANDLLFSEGESFISISMALSWVSNQLSV
jgi:hypothetical protein